MINTAAVLRLTRPLFVLYPYYTILIAKCDTKHKPCIPQENHNHLERACHLNGLLAELPSAVREGLLLTERATIHGLIDLPFLFSNNLCKNRADRTCRRSSVDCTEVLS